MLARMAGRTAAWLAGMGALLFGVAETWDWPGAWAFLGLMGVLSLGVGAWLARHDPELLAERLSPLWQPGQQRWDKMLLAAVALLVVAWLAAMALDAGRWHLSHMPGWLQIVGATGPVASVWLSCLVFRANRFAAPVVKLQASRGHAVATGGPYAVVRHPMYAGALFFCAGMPLLLGSWGGLAFVPALMAVLALRAVLEERLLILELPGYAAYAGKVRYRLVPGVW